MASQQANLISGRRIAIVGLGLMGGSLALALHGNCEYLIGIDSDSDTVQLACKSDIFDQVGQNPKDLLSLVDLVILATPVQAILNLLVEIQAFIPGEAIIMDFGSTKSQILKVMAALPTRLNPIGGHPICGKEKSTFVNAQPELFVGAPFVLTPLPVTRETTLSLALDLVALLGSIPILLDADTHDRLLATTSHLPYLVSNALAAEIPEEAFAISGSGLRSMTRLAGSSIPMMFDILFTNRQNVLDSLRRYRQRLELIENYLELPSLEGLPELLEEGFRGYSVLNSIERRTG